MIDKTMRFLGNHYILGALNSFILLMMSYAAPNDIMKNMALALLIVNILALGRLAIINIKTRTKYKSNICSIIEIASVALNMAIFSRMESYFNINPEFFLWFSVIATIVLIIDIAARSVFIFNLKRKGHELLALERFERVIKKSSSRWRDEFDYIIKMAKGRSTAHEANADMVLKLAKTSLPFGWERRNG